MAFVVGSIGAWYYVFTRSRSAIVAGPFRDLARAEREAGIFNFGSDLSASAGPRTYARSALRVAIAA